MAYEQYHGVCPYCQRHTIFQREAINHILHLIVSLFLCFLWVPVWILLTLTRGHWRCSLCGYTT